MDHSVHNKLVSFIWSIADDCLRDVYVRGKYRDIILPMVVLRRLDTLLEPTKQAVNEEVDFQRNEMDSVELDDEALTAASGYVFITPLNGCLKLFIIQPQITARFCWQILKSIYVDSVLMFRKSSSVLN